MPVFPTLPSDQYKVVGQAADSEGNLRNVYEVQYTTTDLAARDRKWFVCGLCGLSYPFEKGVVVKGRRYCTVLECSREKIADLTK